MLFPLTAAVTVTADRIVVMTPRPGRIRRVIDLPRPRDPTTAECAACIRLVLDELHDDVSLLARR